MKLFSFLIIISIALIAGLNFNGFSGNDFWIQAAVGNWILQNQTLPQTNPFGFITTTETGMMVHQWLSSVLMAGLAEVAGESGFAYALAKTALGLLAFLAIYLVCFSETQNRVISLLMAGFTEIAINFRLTLRAENLVFILLPLYLYFFRKIVREQSRWALIGATLTVTFWANVHGSFVISFLFFGFYAAGTLIDRWRGLNSEISTPGRWLALSALSVMASSLLNPYGLGLWKKALDISTSGYMSSAINEWNPTFNDRFMQVPAFGVYLFFLILSLTLVALTWKKIRTEHLLRLFFFLILSILALRHTAYFFLVAAPTLALSLSLLPNVVIRRRLLFFLSGLLTLSTALVFTFGNLNGWKMHTAFDAPLELSTIRFLETNQISGPVLNSYSLGDQLTYHFFPQALTIIDSRTDVYGEDYLLKFARTLALDEHLFAVLEKFNIRWMVLSQEEYQIYFVRNADRLKKMELQGWRIAFESPYNLVLKRD